MHNIQVKVEEVDFSSIPEYYVFFHTIFIVLGQHNFSPYPDNFCNVWQNSRPCRVWLYNVNGFKKSNFPRISMILYILSTHMLRYKHLKFEDVSAFIKELQICSHYLLDDPRMYG